ncbi:MAG TPA: BrnT family toxin [Blastocatellia bacterium]|nr:BrnT family toxin [Blastocatellia bacterium]
MRVCTDVHTLPNLSFEWDPKKADSNQRKHKVDFADAVTVSEDEPGVTIDDTDPDEERFITLGMDAPGRLLVVVWTWRGRDIRLISARRATPSEREQYNEGL